MNEPLYMVFDVESKGLHGEGFAVGFVVLHGNGEERDARIFSCHLDDARGTPEGLGWVLANVPAMEVTHRSLRELRSTFWGLWASYQAAGAVLVADCPWPVEARFLAACVDDEPTRASQGPYPLYDVTTLRVAAGFHPTAPVERLANERPEHNPLADARQSARLWIEALAKVRG